MVRPPLRPLFGLALIAAVLSPSFQSAVLSAHEPAAAQQKTATTQTSDGQVSDDNGDTRPGYDSLFDGQTLNGWKGLEAFWSVEDGVILGRTTAENPTSANTFLVWQGGDVADFEFRAEVRFSGNNSGVQYRSELVDAEGLALKGYQADLHPKPEYFGMLYGEKTGRGIIAERGSRLLINAEGAKTSLGTLDTSEDLTDDTWNEIAVFAVGDRLIHQINGRTTVDIIDRHPDAASSGKLGLQLHAGPPMTVRFRNLRLRKLTAEEAQAVLEEQAPQEE